MIAVIGLLAIIVALHQLNKTLEEGKRFEEAAKAIDIVIPANHATQDLTSYYLASLEKQVEEPQVTKQAENSLFHLYEQLKE